MQISLVWFDSYGFISGRNPNLHCCSVNQRPAWKLPSTPSYSLCLAVGRMMMNSKKETNESKSLGRLAGLAYNVHLTWSPTMLVFYQDLVNGDAARHLRQPGLSN